jgi:hypothetical protein
LEQRLARPGLAQLRQRIAIQSRLEALPTAEVIRYVGHRLKVAGYEGAELFSPGALELIAERSRGIPRLINNICFNALSLGCARQARQIDSDLAKEAVADLSTDSRVLELGTMRERSSTLRVSGFKPLVSPSYRWIKDRLMRRRLFQTSAVVLMFCGMAIYVGARSGSGTLRQQARHSNSDSAATAARAASGLPDARADAPRVPSPSAETISQSNPDRNPVGSFPYVVQPQDTLRDLCVATLGRYDSAALSEIRELNPELKNIEHLHAGQEIRLPISSTK